MDNLNIFGSEQRFPWLALFWQIWVHHRAVFGSDWFALFWHIWVDADLDLLQAEIIFRAAWDVPERLAVEDAAAQDFMPIRAKLVDEAFLGELHAVANGATTSGDTMARGMINLIEPFQPSATPTPFQ